MKRKISREKSSRTQIMTMGHLILRKKCKAVSDFNKAKKTANKLVEILREAKGAGMAAPQIGVSQRIFVVEVIKTEAFPHRPESPLYIMINPEIVSASEEKESNWEACFSVPGIKGWVPRFKSIQMKYIREDGIEKIEEFEGYLARVIQHEYDHLDGILYLDKAESFSHFDFDEAELNLYKESELVLAKVESLRNEYGINDNNLDIKEWEIW